MMRILDIPGTTERITTFLKKTVKDAGFSRVVVAVSGGIDSCTAVTLATAALDPESVFALSLPYRDWHTDAELRTGRLLRQLQIPASHIRETDIAPTIDAFIRTVDLQHHPENILLSDDLTNVRLGNIMARVRMVMLFDYAKWLSALVLGTENKSEHYLGYYTRFGDEASDIEPLRNLYKTEVYQLAEHLGIPKEIRDAVPTAGLWQGQTDEGQFGFTYQSADEILYGLYDAKRSPQELIESGLDKQTIDLVQAWVAQMAFKHSLPWIGPEPVSVLN
ncbi:MAG: NAD(+) synthase [Anaerolineae bacterium]|nr:NAD(+) synthase [Anaerolineae bacterium]